MMKKHIIHYTPGVEKKQMKNDFVMREQAQKGIIFTISLYKYVFYITIFSQF